MRLSLILFCILPLLTACGKSEEKEFTYRLLSPASSDIFKNGDVIIIEVEVSDFVTNAEFYFDNIKIGSSNGDRIRFEWTPQAVSGGIRTLTVEIYPMDYAPVTLNVSLVFEYNEGEQNQGGMIFYLDETRIHGMAVALSDITYGNKEAFHWGPEFFIGATDTADGSVNTSILSHNELMSNYIWNAFKLGYIYAGYDDWYVASRKEMLTLVDFVATTENDLSMNKSYWTSTECCRALACAVDFNSRKAITCLKADSLFRIRPIRKF